MKDGTKRHDLIYKSNYHSSKWPIDKLKSDKTKIIMSKPLYLGLKITDLCKIKMYELLYVYLKEKCCKKAKLY